MSTAAYTQPTDAELQAQASSQVGSELQGQIDPLQRESESLISRETSAVSGIGSMFDQLQPFVSGEADKVQSSYDLANNASRQIFEEAQRRIGELANKRASDAQALSQQMGGPVAVGEFTAGVEPDQTALASIAPNELLHGLANAQAGVQEARAFSGRVFPAMRTEQVANARGYFEDQVRDIRKQIDQINASRSSLTNTRFQELQTKEREYALQQAQLALDKLKADRDWEATQRTLHNEDTRLNLAKKQFGVQEAGVTGTYKGRPTLQTIKLSADQKLAARRLGLSNAQYRERVRHNQETESAARARLNKNLKKNAMSIIDSVSGRSKSGVTLTQKHYLTDAQGAVSAIKNTKVHYNPKAPKGQRYYVYETVHLSPQQAERQYGSGYASDPQALYDTLIGSNIPRPVALNLVRTRTGVHDFSPGKPVRYTAEDLRNIGKKSFNELRGIALARGFKPNRKKPANTQQFIDFILSTNP